MIRKSVLLLAVLVIAASARAQFAVYGTFTLDHLTNIQSSPVLNTLTPAPCTGSATTGCTPYRNGVDPLGMTGGVYYDYKQVGPALLGLDLRGVITSARHGAQDNAEGAGAHIYSGLAGVRATFHTPFSYMRPYGELAAGYGRSNFGVLTNATHNGTTYPGSTSYGGFPTENGVEYHVYAGVDFKLAPILDFRAVELGYGGINTFGTYGHAYPILSVSSGIVLHFPHN